MSDKSFESALSSMDDDSSSGSSSSSSSSGSKSSYPKFRELVPILAIIDDGSGPELVKRPQEYAVHEWKKDSKTPYEFHSVDDEIQYYWMSQDALRLMIHRWNQIADEDFWDVAETDMAKLLRGVQRVDEMKTVPDDICSFESCPVCRERNHVLWGKFVTMQGRRVCSDHTADELVDSGFIRKDRNRRV